MEMRKGSAVSQIWRVPKNNKKFERKISSFKFKINICYSYFTCHLNLLDDCQIEKLINLNFKTQIFFYIFLLFYKNVEIMGAGATFDWTFFDNSKLIDFDC